MKLAYDIKDKPKAGQLIIFAFQQLLAILAATIAVPSIVGNGMSQSAALFGAGVGTLVYLLFTRCKSPVFLGSSFAFIGSMFAAFAGASSMNVGYLGLIFGAIFAGLVYVVIALVVKAAGVAWINKLMPAVVIGPTVAIIGLSLAGNAIGDMLAYTDEGFVMTTKGAVGFICALVTLFTVMICSVFGKKMSKLIPFIIGIAAGYIVATCFTLIGKAAGNASLMIVDIADHKNLSSIIEKDLLEDPGLHNTLLGDGVGSMVGAFFGGCPNTTYGESVGCVAITGNASVVTILATAVLAIVASFVAPFVTLLSTIPSCVMGGVCVTLYGFIAVSGLKMIQKVDLDQNKNLFVVSVILIAGVGGMSMSFGKVTLTEVACALILGIITNLILSRKKDDEPVEEIAAPVEETVEESFEAEEEAVEAVIEE